MPRKQSPAIPPPIPDEEDFDWGTFEEFTQRRVRGGSDEPRVALYRTSGNFAINRAAYEALGEPERVVLYYEASTQTIGIQKSPGPLRHSYVVTRQASSANSFTMTGIAFVKLHGISVDQTRVWSPAPVRKGGLVLRLADAQVSEYRSLADELEPPEEAAG